MNQSWMHWVFDVVLGVLFWFLIADRKSVKDDIKKLDEEKADDKLCHDEREVIFGLLREKVDTKTLKLEKNNALLRFTVLEDRVKEQYIILCAAISDVKGDNKSEHKELKECVNSVFELSRNTKDQMLKINEQLKHLVKEKEIKK